MNEYCKSCLKHSWGKSPERKKLEKDYNLNYYQTNRSRILQRAAERRNQPKTVTDTIVEMSPTTLYEPGEFAYYSEESFKDIANAGKRTIASIKKATNSIKKGMEFVKKKLKTPIEMIKNTKLVKSVKNFFDKVKYYKSKATI